eukprot:TRINITY_DN2401_c0_g12_i1.p1 TRINITY_DN2401_c0_g12~~TRINITY_DN2401_c0_g12_i1.p1  ORF type:complete len:233 (+),score=29.15 TRINITY_DN2401_c0_g12_i1:170-868(+)
MRLSVRPTQMSPIIFQKTKLKPNYHHQCPYFLNNFAMSLSQCGMPLLLMFCTFCAVNARKLPNFDGKNPSGKSRSDPKHASTKVLAELSPTKTLKDSLASEFRSNTLVYERLYPNSLPINQRKSLFFTELMAVSARSLPDFYLGKVLGEEEMLSYYKPRDVTDRTLVFESRFESGNLKLALKKSEKEYDLYVQNDVNTRGNTQWFFFRVHNTTKGHRVLFNIKNFVLPFLPN